MAVAGAEDQAADPGSEPGDERAGGRAGGRSSSSRSAGSSGPEVSRTRSLEQVLLEKGQALFTGRIDVALGSWVGALHLVDGQLVDARVGSLSGEPALWRLLLPRAPRISAEAGRAKVSGGAVLGRPDALLPRARERLALLERLAEKVGGLERVWALRFDALQAQLLNLPDGIHPVLRLLDGKRDVRQVVAECPIDDVLALRILAKLLTQGILVLPDTTVPEPSQQIIDVEGGLEEALSAALAELSADDLELPERVAEEPPPAEPAAPAPRAPLASLSSEPPGPMPAPAAPSPAGDASTSPTAPAATEPPALPAATALAQHLALPRPVPPVATADELRAWLGMEEAFFSVPPVPAPSVPPRAAPLPWAALTLLGVVAVLAGIALGRGCL